MARRPRLLLSLALLGGAACSEPVLYLGVGADPTATPPTWQEHWFEHDQLLTLAQSDDATALYYDKDVDPTQASAIFPYVSQIAHYTNATYGPLGPGRLYVIIHKDRYLGCHEADHYNPSHDYRNTIDCGLMTYDDQTILGAFIPHFMAVLVEHVVDDRQGAPADVLWNHQGKWAEFYRYDLYLGIGRKDEADAWYAQWTADAWTDPFPAANTHWFRGWFYPLWRDHGGAAVMSRFFGLLARDFPSSGGKYTRDMDWGEFVHFMSGAAGTDLHALATEAFGWSVEWEAELQAARAAFPRITY
ncbi:MAG TPA: hypothetical protein VHL80_19025 [Polyangia bacterium]|nr:hypothetical protein [Polyangia bacterium]